MTRVINNPKVKKMASYTVVYGRKYKEMLVERGIFNPIEAIITITDEDMPMYGSDATRLELGIHRGITKINDHQDYLWVFDSGTNPLVDDIELLKEEMISLQFSNR